MMMIIIIIIIIIYTCRQDSSSGKDLDYGLGALGSILGVEVVEIFLHFFVTRLVPGPLSSL